MCLLMKKFKIRIKYFFIFIEIKLNFKIIISFLSISLLKHLQQII